MRGITLKDNESIVLELRQHGFVYARSWIMSLAFLTATSYFLFWLLEQGLWGQIVVGIGYTVGTVILVRMLVYLRGTVLIITTDRVIDIDKPTLFSKDITQIKLRDIEDVEGKVKGIFGTLFRIGEVRVTSHRSVAIRMGSIRSPLDVQDIIEEVMEQKEVARSTPTINDKAVLGYLDQLDVSELDAMLRKAMELLRKKKAQ